MIETTKNVKVYVLPDSELRAHPFINQSKFNEQRTNAEKAASLKSSGVQAQAGKRVTGRGESRRMGRRPCIPCATHDTHDT